MKTPHIIIAIAALALASCSTYYADKSVIGADGSKHLDREIFAQLGGRGSVQRGADGSLGIEVDNEKSFRDGVTGAVAYGALREAGRTERTNVTERNQTERAEISAGAGVERERLRQAGGAAGTIANPETPPEAGRTIGRLLGR